MSRKSHFINNVWIEGNGAGICSRNPASSEIVWEGRNATGKEVDQAVAAADGAFENWSDRSIEDRTRHLEAFRDQLSSNGDYIAELISQDTGKPKWEALTESQSMVGKITVSVEAYNDRCGAIKGRIAGAETVTRFRPHGAVAVLGPFNLPGHLPNGQIVPALLAGNTVVFKPSSQAPLVAEFIIKLWESTEIPAGVINLVQGGSDTGRALSEHPRLRGLFFTGSAATGKGLHRAFGGFPDKILVLEMGGNNPLVVHEVSNAKAAAYLTVISAYITSGQRCSCARRLIVTDGERGDNFLECLVETTRTIRVGRYTDSPQPFMGPVISTQSGENLLAAQQRLVNNGGKILLEMRSQGKTVNMLSPGIIDVTSVDKREDEELFGPLLQVIRVPDFDSAIRESNNTKYGLAASLLCDKLEFYEKFRRRIRAGVINWNRQTTGADAGMPFGGIGSSGNHRPGAYFTADHCSYPVASIEAERIAFPDIVVPGINY